MILDRLADATRARYAQRMTDTPLDIVKSRALALPKGNFAFERALGAPGVSLICEVTVSYTHLTLPTILLV